MDASIDWQTGCHELKMRGKHLLKTGQWADCHFLVGSEPNQTLMPGHKLILAMASPVFDAMFNGGLPEKNDPIPILDVQPDAFRGLLEYIYTDAIQIASMDKACELCYVAKKYMLPHVVERCTQFLWSDLCAKNVCRAYEFAILFEEPSLAERCLQIICTQTEEMLADASFEEIQLETLLVILEQEYLQIGSELDLFLAVVRYAEKHELGAAEDEPLPIGDQPMQQPHQQHQQEQQQQQEAAGVIQQRQQQPPQQQQIVIQHNPHPHHQQQQRDDLMNVSMEEPVVNVDVDNEPSPQPPPPAPQIDGENDGAIALEAATPPPPADDGAAAAAIPDPNHQQHQQQPHPHPRSPTFRDVVKRIRFLTLTPKQFAENVARSSILTQAEAFAILMNISSPQHDIYPMPAGFSASTKSRSAYAESAHPQLLGQPHQHLPNGAYQVGGAGGYANSWYPVSGGVDRWYYCRGGENWQDEVNRIEMETKSYRMQNNQNNRYLIMW